MAEYELLRKMDLFWGMNDSELKLFWDIASSTQFAAGQVIFEEGDPCDRLYIITSGAVEISTLISDDARQVLGELRRGSECGEMALIDDAPRSATARALEATTLLSVGRDAFLDLIEHNATFAAKALINLSRTLSKRLRATNDVLRRTALWSLKAAQAATLSLNSLVQQHKTIQVYLLGQSKIKGVLLKVEKSDSGYELTIEDEGGQVFWIPYHAVMYIEIDERTTMLPLGWQ